MARSASLFEPRHLVLMGVSGCGKSTVGTALSGLIDLPYLDGDDLHPAENIRKMRAGESLADADRWPWLDRCGAALKAAPGGLILGCSALRRCYRDRLRKGAAAPRLRFIHLGGDPEVLFARMTIRRGHFMPASLLHSQLATLEPPGEDECALGVSVTRPLAEILQDIMAALGHETGPAQGMFDDAA